MSKRKPKDKEKKKASQLVVRVEKAERDAFVALCNALDTSAAREIRRFMRDMVASEAAKAIDDAVEPAQLVSAIASADEANVVAGTEPTDAPIVESPVRAAGKVKKKPK
jgi:hypothetical protein